MRALSRKIIVGKWSGCTFVRMPGKIYGKESILKMEIRKKYAIQRSTYSLAQKQLKRNSSNSRSRSGILRCWFFFIKFGNELDMEWMKNASFIFTIPMKNAK